MTKVKIDSKLSGPAAYAVEPLAQPIYARPGVHIVGVVELAHVERTQPAPDEDTEPSVKLAIRGLEVAREGEQEEHLRKAMRALYLQRTATGTLDEQMRPELSDRTVELTAEFLNGTELARLRTAIGQWAAYAHRAGSGAELTLQQYREELQQIGAGLAAALRWDEGAEDGGR